MTQSWVVGSRLRRRARSLSAPAVLLVVGSRAQVPSVFVAPKGRSSRSVENRRRPAPGRARGKRRSSFSSSPSSSSSSSSSASGHDYSSSGDASSEEDSGFVLRPSSSSSSSEEGQFFPSSSFLLGRREPSLRPVRGVALEGGGERRSATRRDVCDYDYDCERVTPQAHNPASVDHPERGARVHPRCRREPPRRHRKGGREESRPTRHQQITRLNPFETIARGSLAAAKTGAEGGRG